MSVPQRADCAKNEILDGKKCRQILEYYLLSFHHERLTLEYLFQHDSTGPHIAQIITGKRRRLPSGQKVELPSWFSDNCIRQFITYYAFDLTRFIAYCECVGFSKAKTD